MNRTLLSFTLAISALLLSGCVLFTPRKAQERSAMVEQMKGVTIKTINWQDTPLQDAVRFLEQSSGLNDKGEPKIRLQFRVIPAKLYIGTLTYSAHNISMYQAFHILEQMYDMTWKVEAGEVILNIRGLRHGDHG